MIGTIDIKINAAHPNMPLSTVYTFLGSPQQVRIINVPKAIGNWKITAVQVTVNYPDNSSPSVEATLVGGCWSATLPAPSAVGQSLMGFKVTASGVDEHNDPITGYVLGKGDAYVLDDDATITVGGTTYYVHLVDTTPEVPHKGDLDLSTMKLWNGSAWVSLGADITLDDTVTETSANGVKSSGIWTWVKSLLPSWLTPSREEPPTQASVAAKYTKPSDGIPLSDLKPTTFPPEAHTHTNDSWFTTAIAAVTTWATNAFAAITHSHASDDWFTTALAGKADESELSSFVFKGGDEMTGTLLVKHYLEVAQESGGYTVRIIVEDNRAFLLSVTGDNLYLPENKTGTFALVSDIPDVTGKANVSDFSPSTPASYVTDFVQESAALANRIRSLSAQLSLDAQGEIVVTMNTED